MGSLTFKAYQATAKDTDRNSGADLKSVVIPLLGLVGEAGSLLGEYKKLLRDGGAHKRFKQQAEEELGDILWYVANIATKFDLDLSALAQRNLIKTRQRWSTPAGVPATLDEGDPPAQQFPRKFVYSLQHETVAGRQKVVVRDEAGNPVGDAVTDNSYDDDGYRFHDVIHFAFMAKLGWSPVLRKLLGKKRKQADDPTKDEVEDGARAAAIEEAIATTVAEYARRHGGLEGTDSVDWAILQWVRRMTEDREVSVRTEAEWEAAIVTAIKVWKQVHDAGGGRVRGDLIARTLTMEPL